MKNFFIENIKTLIYALIIAMFIRSIFIQPFYIPSSSMEPNLLVGDRLFVTKYSYGYSKHSFPFSPPIFKGRLLFNEPKRGDVIVFKTPADNRTDYIKRLIGISGDTIQFIDGSLYLNNNQILQSIYKKDDNVYCGNQKINVTTFNEKLSDGKTYKASYRTDHSFMNSDKYIEFEKSRLKDDDQVDITAQMEKIDKLKKNENKTDAKDTDKDEKKLSVNEKQEIVDDLT